MKELSSFSDSDAIDFVKKDSLNISKGVVKIFKYVKRNFEYKNEIQFNPNG